MYYLLHFNLTYTNLSSCLVRFNFIYFALIMASDSLGLSWTINGGFLSVGLTSGGGGWGLGTTPRFGNGNGSSAHSNYFTDAWELSFGS